MGCSPSLRDLGSMKGARAVDAARAGSVDQGTRSGRRGRRADGRNEDVATNTQKTDAVREALAQLEVLSVDLAGRGYETHPVDAPRTLSVANQAIPDIRGEITIGPTGDGAWWFLWSSGDRIAPVTDIETAAFKIAYVLTPALGRTGRKP